MVLHHILSGICRRCNRRGNGRRPVLLSGGIFLLALTLLAPAHASYEDALRVMSGANGLPDYLLGEAMLRECAWVDDDIDCQLALGRLYRHGVFPDGKVSTAIKTARVSPPGPADTLVVEALVWFTMAINNMNEDKDFLTEEDGFASFGSGRPPPGPSHRNTRRRAMVECRELEDELPLVVPPMPTPPPPIPSVPPAPLVDPLDNLAALVAERLIYIYQSRGGPGLMQLGELFGSDYVRLNPPSTGEMVPGPPRPSPRCCKWIKGKPGPDIWRNTTPDPVPLQNVCQEVLFVDRVRAHKRQIDIDLWTLAASGNTRAATARVALTRDHIRGPLTSGVGLAAFQTARRRAFGPMTPLDQAQYNALDAAEQEIVRSEREKRDDFNLQSAFQHFKEADRQHVSLATEVVAWMEDRFGARLPSAAYAPLRSYRDQWLYPGFKFVPVPRVGTAPPGAIPPAHILTDVSARLHKDELLVEFLSRWRADDRLEFVGQALSSLLDRRVPVRGSGLATAIEDFQRAIGAAETGSLGSWQEVLVSKAAAALDPAVPTTGGRPANPNPASSYFVGAMYQFGGGAFENFDVAHALYKQSAAHTNPDPRALCKLYWFYVDNKFLPRDLIEAGKYKQRIAGLSPARKAKLRDVECKTF